MQKDVIKNWLFTANERIQEKKDFLSELDRAIGDGDHGVNMSRGFAEAVQKIRDNEPADIAGLMQTVAMTLIAKVGGASGPLYGTAFLKAATYLKGKADVTVRELGEAFKESLIGIKQRGKAELGQKTMVDVWEPVVEKWLSYDGAVDFDELRALAEASLEKTKDLEATKGRAAYLGKRSIGHLDPGAYSSYLLFDALFNELKGVKA